MRAPFPWFGGKSSVAEAIWARLGDVPNYVEPFFGSGAVMLARPHDPRTETINDADHFVANFWRAVKAAPEAVAHHADWPVNETDLAARHYWLITVGAARIVALESNSDLFDAEVAGRWVWGLCSWIGAGWCSGDGPWQASSEGWVKRDGLIAENGIRRKRPHMGNAGQGINSQRPHISPGQGINRQGGRGDRQTFILDWMNQLSGRLRDVRVAAGDWQRVCGPSVTHVHGLTGVFLDPPYADTAGRTADLYSTDCLMVAHAVREWAIAEGGNKLMRICLAGYDGEHAMPDDWETVEWKTHGGYGNNGAESELGRVNSTRERLWFSPHCLKPERARSLFDFADELEAAE